ncbi:MAG: glycosyltransferase family 2 protein [Armatimonadota bacterium]
MIIVNWNSCDSIRTCLSGLQARLDERHEVLVVDNASSDGSVEMIRSEFPWVHVLPQAMNLGFGGGANVGAAASQGQFLLFLNPDSTAAELDADALVDAMKKHADTGIAGIRVLNPDGSLQMSCRRFPIYEAGLFRNTMLGRLFPNNRYLKAYLMLDFQHDRIQPVDWVSGCAMVVRKACWDTLQGFDERFFMYCEDVDICWRAHKANWQVQYLPVTSVHHRIGSSTDLAVNKMIRCFHRSHWQFYLKNYYPDSNIFTAGLVWCLLQGRANLLVLRNYIIWLRTGRPKQIRV